MTVEQVKEIQEKFYKEFPIPYIWPSMKKDHEALLFLLHNYGCKSFLELGTWQSYTARLIYESGITNITTMDIHEGMQTGYVYPAYEYLKKEDVGKYLKPVGIEPRFVDSMNYTPFEGEKYDAIFVDANHDYHHVKNDTMLALKMATKVIIWHDYCPGNPGVVRWLDEFKKEKQWKLYHPDSVVAYLVLE